MGLALFSKQMNLIAFTKLCCNQPIHHFSPLHSFSLFFLPSEPCLLHTEAEILGKQLWQSRASQTSGNNRAQPSMDPVLSTQLQHSLSQGSQHSHWVFIKMIRLWFKPQNKGEAEGWKNDRREKQT